MAQKTILSANQIKLLEIISRDKNICADFYLTGGTALAEFYLLHRYSEDLDFFSEEEVDPQNIYSFFKSVKKEAGIKKIDMETSYNRNLFFLHLFDGDIIKTEFTYFPFPRIEEKKLKNGLKIDSLLDIAVNKIFTIYQKPRSRDFIDLFYIIKEKKYKVEDLVKKAKIKFDWHVDLLQLGSKFLEAEKLKDYPRMIEKIAPDKWIKFFLEEAKGMKADILS